MDDVVSLANAARADHFLLIAQNRVGKHVLETDRLQDERIVDVEIRPHDLQESIVFRLNGRLIGQLVVATVEGIADTAELVTILRALNLEGLHPHSGMQKVRGDLLALAGHLGAEERREHTDGQSKCALMVADCGDEVGRHGALLVKGARPAAARKERRVVESGKVLVGALLAIAGKAGIDEARVAAFKVLVSEILASKRLRTPIGEKNIGVIEQLEENLAPLVGAQVDDDALFAGILQIEVDVLMRVGRTALVRGGEAKVIALRGLDFHDFGTQVGQDAANSRNRDERCHLENLYSFERTLGVFHVSSLSVVRSTIGSRLIQIYCPKISLIY